MGGHYGQKNVLVSNAGEFPGDRRVLGTRSPGSCTNGDRNCSGSVDHDAESESFADAEPESGGKSGSESRTESEPEEQSATAARTEPVAN